MWAAKNTLTGVLHKEWLFNSLVKQDAWDQGNVSSSTSFSHWHRFLRGIVLCSAFPNYSDLQTPFSLVLVGVREENYSSVADGPGDAGVVGEQTDSAPSADTRFLKSLFCTRTPSRGQAPGLWWGFHLTRAGALTNIHVNTSMKGERWAGLECNYTIICGKCKTDEDFWIFLFIWYVSLINPEEQFRCCHYTWCNTETMNSLSKASLLGGGVETGSMYPSTVLNLFTYLPVCCDYRHVPPHPVQRIVLI